MLGRFYAPAMAALSSEINTRTLLSHGRVLTDFDWRVSRVTSSNIGRGLELPIITLTLKYQEAGESKAMTFDAIPSVLHKLRQAIEGLLK